MPRITPVQIAMGVGASGALTDVSTYVDLQAGITRDWGRQTEFEDIAPGTFSFVLDNADGRFTPGNTSSPLDTTVTEGMSVCWNLGGRLVAGTILAIEPLFPGDDAAWGQVKITCDDMLGAAGRRTLDGLGTSMVQASTPYLYWPFNDAAESIQALEQSGSQGPAFSVGFSPTLETFGVEGFDALDGATQLQLSNTSQIIFATSSLVSVPGATFVPGNIPTIDYPTSSMGTWGAWFTPVSGSPYMEVFIRPNGYNTALSPSFRFGINSSQQYAMKMGAASSVVSSVPVTFGEPHYLQMVVTYSGSTSITGEFFVDGVSQGTADYVPGGGDPAGLSTNYERTPMWVALNALASPSGVVNVAELSHTEIPVPAYLLHGLATEAAALTTAAHAVSEATLATLPSDLSTAPVQIELTGSALDAFNSILLTEQGVIYATTSGTLTSPSQVLTVRARTRPATVEASWDVTTEIAGAPDFVRDITNMVSTVRASGPTRDVLLTDRTLIPRVGSANTSESILNTEYVDLLMWAQDRLQRGANVNLRLASVTIDAMTTPSDRTSDLLALVPGDRHQFTGLPETQLGFSTWDGWLLGVTEFHSVTEHTFTLYFQPVLPDTAIYDTNYFMADGALTLSADITSGATTMSVATSVATTLLETSTFPYDLVIGSEQVTVTGCTTATPQVATITRGVNGTTAAAHTAGAAVEVAVESLYAF